MGFLVIYTLESDENWNVNQCKDLEEWVRNWVELEPEINNSPPVEAEFEPNIMRFKLVKFLPDELKDIFAWLIKLVNLHSFSPITHKLKLVVECSGKRRNFVVQDKTISIQEDIEVDEKSYTLISKVGF